MKLYLAHPLADRVFHLLWENGFEERTDIQLLNPFYDVPRQDIIDFDNGVTDRVMASPDDIVLRDLEAMQSTEGVVAVINKHTSIGTIMEICYAYSFHGMEVYVICTDGRDEHPWLKYHSTKIFTSYVEFEEWICCQDTN